MGRMISEQLGAAKRRMEQTVRIRFCSIFRHGQSEFGTGGCGQAVCGAKSTHWRYYSFDHPGGHEDAAMPKPPCPPRVLAVVAVMRGRVPLGWRRDRVRGKEGGRGGG